MRAHAKRPPLRVLWVVLDASERRDVVLADRDAGRVLLDEFTSCSIDEHPAKGCHVKGLRQCGCSRSPPENPIDAQRDVASDEPFAAICVFGGGRNLALAAT